jgi:hypothetical protein
MRMNSHKIIGLIIFIICTVSCSSNRQPEKNICRELTFADSLWIEFAKALERHDTKYLIGNSFDTVHCVDCLQDSIRTGEYYDSKDIFQNHLKEFMHIDSLSNTEFSSYQDDSLIQISYNIKWRYAEEGAYGLIFTFIKSKDKYLFKERYFMP